MALRLRLRFDSACGVAEDSRSHGVLQWWFAVTSGMSSIADVASGIISFFRLQKSCPYGILLLMEDFALPPMQSVTLLNDKDLICVKPVGLSSNVNLQWGQYSNTEVLRLRAVEEFEKESGGYRSEDEDLGLNVSNEDQSTEFPASLLPKTSRPKRLANAIAEPPVFQLCKRLKKRKKIVQVDNASKEKRGKKRKCALAGDEEILGADQKDKIKKKKTENKRPEETEGEQQAREDINAAVDSDPAKVRGCRNEESEPSNAAAAVDTTGNESVAKRPSRSARRKKAKRAWVKANKTAEKAADHDIDNVLKSNQNDDVYENRAVKVTPGHIRFEPLESPDNRQHEVAPTLNFGSGLRSKKQGQSWGQEKRAARKDHNSTWDNGNLEPEHGEDDNYVEGVTESGRPTVDFDNLPQLTSSVEQGDILVYKLLELSSSGTPEISAFRVGEVASFDNSSNFIKMLPVPDYPIEKPDEKNELNDTYQEDGSLEMDLSFLLDVRVLRKASANNESTKTSAPDEASNSQQKKKAEAPQPNSKEEPSASQNQNQGPPLTKAEKWHLKSLRASALGPTLRLLRAQNDLGS